MIIGSIRNVPSPALSGRASCHLWC
jgi:hypothetical protein